MPSLPPRPRHWHWDALNGIGFLPLGENPVPYNEGYYQKYVGYAATPQGKAITAFRCRLVREYVANANRTVLDVGVGCGDFVFQLRANGWRFAFGTDINPFAVEALRQRGALWPDESQANVLTFWDVLEHIPDPSVLFRHHRPKWVLVSMPIYRNEAHVFVSKHFRPGEHCWYFTNFGLKRYMEMQGFTCLGYSHEETTLHGREDIGTFVFHDNKPR